MEIFNARRMMSIGVLAVLYFVLTMLCVPLVVGQIQFRLSEMLVLLCIYNPDYILSVTLGCFIANMFGSVSADLLLGTGGTLIAAVVIYVWRDKNIFLLSLIPVISNAILVGVELTIYDEGTFWQNAASVAVGEFVCVSVIGMVLLLILRRSKDFMKIVTFGMEQKKE